MIRNRALTKTNRELVLALESARTRLAVAIASEAKSTPLDRWQYYLETADKMRRFSKKLRMGSGALQEREEWMRALEALRRLPVQSKALPLCRMLRELIADPGAELA